MLLSKSTTMLVSWLCVSSRRITCHDTPVSKECRLHPEFYPRNALRKFKFK